MSLFETQNSFMEYLLSPELASSNFSKYLSTEIKLAPEKQQEVYLKNINGSHQNTLAKIFPACFNILGENYYNQLSRSYRKQHPSNQVDFNHYGKQFPDYLQLLIENNHKLKSFYYLHELSILEWHWHQSFFYSNAGEFDLNSFNSQTNDNLEKIILEPSSNIHFNKTDLPLIDLWNANRSTPEHNQNFSLPNYTTYFCIVRTDLLPELVIISQTDYDLFIGLDKQTSFYEILSNFKHPACPIPEFIQKNWITGFHLMDQSC